MQSQVSSSPVGGAVGCTVHFLNTTELFQACTTILSMLGGYSMLATSLFDKLSAANKECNQRGAGGEAGSH